MIGRTQKHLPIRRRRSPLTAGPGGWRDWWTLLHPPYTAWHLSYVVIGAVSRHTSAPPGSWPPSWRSSSLSALRPMPWTNARASTRNPHPGPDARRRHGRGPGRRDCARCRRVLRVGWALIPFMVLGPLLVLAYNLELFGGSSIPTSGSHSRGAPSPCWSRTWHRPGASPSARCWPPGRVPSRRRNVVSARRPA